MGPSDVAAYSSLLDKAGTIGLLVAIVLALVALARWLLKVVLEGKDKAIAYRDQLIDKREAQIERQQDLFDQALGMLKEEMGQRHTGGARGTR